MPTTTDFLNAMRSYLGVVEDPDGSNRTRIGEEFGWNGVPWCAETISVAARQAGFGTAFWSASTDTWEARARRREGWAVFLGATSTPQPGDICVWDYIGDGTPNHVSVVEAVREDGMLITLGGNESNRCQRAVRSKKGLRGYIRLPFVAPTPPPPPAPATNAEFGAWPTTNKPVVRKGAKGGVVVYLQSVIDKRGGGGIAVDGIFGPQTERRVKDLQRFFKLAAVDGIVGPKTWGVVDFLATFKL